MPPAVRRASVALATALPSRRTLGWAIVTAGTLVQLHWLWQHGTAWLADEPLIAAALVAGLAAAAATAVGTLPVAFALNTSERTRDALLGFGAGVMLAASVFSLTVPALAAAQAQGAGRMGASLWVGAGIGVGALLLWALDRWLPQQRFIEDPAGHARAQLVRRTWLFVGAVMLHNLPEGLAIGVAYAGGDIARAGALATGIAIQDVPEGLVIALALLAAGYRRVTAVTLGALSGLMEPLGALLGAAAVALSVTLLPWGLALAAGAMLWVIVHDVVPQSLRSGHDRWASAALVAGFALMMVLDTALG